jgi:hypothetical protein
MRWSVTMETVTQPALTPRQRNRRKYPDQCRARALLLDQLRVAGRPLTVPELVLACSEIAGRRTIARAIEQLWRQREVRRLVMRDPQNARYRVEAYALPSLGGKGSRVVITQADIDQVLKVCEALLLRGQVRSVSKIHRMAQTLSREQVRLCRGVLEFRGLVDGQESRGIRAMTWHRPDGTVKTRTIAERVKRRTEILREAKIARGELPTGLRRVPVELRAIGVVMGRRERRA